MNKYVKEFLMRGMMFSGFGPIIYAIIIMILSYTLPDFSITAMEVFKAVLSTYLLAFVHAGASVFNQIESWSVLKSLLCHLSTLYVAYTIYYLANAWLTYSWAVIGIYTAIFIVGYALIWTIVYCCVRVSAKRLNVKIKKA